MLILAVDPGVRGGYCLGSVETVQILDAGETPRLHVPFRSWRREPTVPDLRAVLARMWSQIYEVGQSWSVPVPRPLIVFEAAWSRPRQSVVSLWSQACEYASLLGQTLEAVRHWVVVPVVATVAPMKWISWYNARAADDGKPGIVAAVARRFPALDIERFVRGPRGGLLTGVSDAVGLYGYAHANYQALVEAHYHAPSQEAKPRRTADRVRRTTGTTKELARGAGS